VSATALPEADLSDGLVTLMKTSVRALVLACNAPGQTGPERVEQMTGYSRGTISRWCGDRYTDLPPLDVVFQLESAIGKPIVSRMLASLTGHQVVPLSEDAMVSGAADLMSGVMRATGSHARFVAKAAEAMEDEVITPGEAKALLAKILKHQQDMGEIAQLLAKKAGI
jgi:hypothetical protein